MAEAIGYRFLDADGNALPRGGAALGDLATIDVSGRLSGIEDCEILVACDVTNPLCGPNGASHIYGPQKGADAKTVNVLDAALRHFAEIVREQLGVDVAGLPGAGAAGGLGAGLVAFARGSLRPGVDLVADACHLAERINGADLVITGEGKLDGQTIHGKTPIGVARVAQRADVPVVAVAGVLGDGYEAVYDFGVDIVYALCTGSIAPDYALAHATELLAGVGETIGIERSARSGH